MITIPEAEEICEMIRDYFNNDRYPLKSYTTSNNIKFEISRVFHEFRLCVSNSVTRDKVLFTFVNISAHIDICRDESGTNYPVMSITASRGRDNKQELTLALDGEGRYDKW